MSWHWIGEALTWCAIGTMFLWIARLERRTAMEYDVLESSLTSAEARLKALETASVTKAPRSFAGALVLAAVTAAFARSLERRTEP